MNKNRLEAFSDAMLAILMTIMVLELKAPHGSMWSDLVPILPTLGSYVLSFVYIGIYWGNHHHLVHTVARVNGKIIWANMQLLFWLSLIPFATNWMGDSNFQPVTVAVYGGLLAMCALAFTILALVIERGRSAETSLTKALRSTRVKEYVSLTSYLASVPLAFVSPWIACCLFVIIAILWVVPSKAIETALGE